MQGVILEDIGGVDVLLLKRAIVHLVIPLPIAFFRVLGRKYLFKGTNRPKLESHCNTPYISHHLLQRTGITLKLSKRLKQIASMVTSEYSHIWDCCCDHGLLGTSLLSRQAAPCIHFVDIVPELMDKLENKLHHFYPNKSSYWKTYCLDVTALPLEHYNGKHLVIIAGIGGDLMTQFVDAIYRHHPTTNIDFLLCPVRHQFTLRQRIIELDFRLQNEVLIEENHRFYEIILVSTPTSTNNTHPKINPVGVLIWQASTSEQIKIAGNYLNNTLNHYQRILLGSDTEVQHIIDAYRSVIILNTQTG